MLGRIENLDKKTFGEVQEDFAIRQGPLHQVITLKRDYIALLFEWHNAKMIEREHGGVCFVLPLITILCHAL